jgi:hypothetical protein
MRSLPYVWRDEAVGALTMTVASRIMLHASRFMVHGSWFHASRFIARGDGPGRLDQVGPIFGPTLT